MDDLVGLEQFLYEKNLKSFQKKVRVRHLQNIHIHFPVQTTIAVGIHAFQMLQHYHMGVVYVCKGISAELYPAIDYFLELSAYLVSTWSATGQMMHHITYSGGSTSDHGIWHFKLTFEACLELLTVPFCH